jgi:hypothetical protein
MRHAKQAKTNNQQIGRFPTPTLVKPGLANVLVLPESFRQKIFSLPYLKNPRFL